MPKPRFSDMTKAVAVQVVMLSGTVSFISFVSESLQEDDEIVSLLEKLCEKQINKNKTMCSRRLQTACFQVYWFQVLGLSLV